MSLPSQSSRNATRSSQVHYRRSSAGPVRKVVTALIVIGLLVLVWYTLIRPAASELVAEADQNTDQPTDQTINQPETAQGNTPIEQRPVVINNSPARPLPGADGNTDPRGDVERAIRSNTPANSNTSPGSSRPATRPSTQPSTNTSPSTDILDAASNTDQTNTQPSTQPSNQSRNTGLSSGIRLQLDSARRLVAENNRVGARKLLSQALTGADITHSQAQVLRDELTAINEVLLFSPVVDPDDPMSESYKVQSGDSLSRIAGRRELATHWKLISRVNQIADPSKIRLGQTLKLVRGPFHAIVYKSAHRIDIYHGSPADPKSWLYIKSFDVGLGSNDGTPVGEFVVSANKLENPGWVNPRDARDQYLPDDPANPIGEYWIGLTGVGKYSTLTSLGIHGTIDQDSIGGDESMGCVRLAEGDIDTVYELLSEHISRVLIVP